MSLKDAIAEVEKEEKKALNVEEVQDDKPQEEEPEKKEEAAPEGDEGKEEDAGEPETPENKPEEKPAAPPENADFARLRREKAASDRRAAAAEAQLKQKPTESAKPANADTEPDQNTDPEAHLRWELRQARNDVKSLTDWRQAEERKQQQITVKDSAVKAFGNYEQAFSPTVKDYDDVMKFGVQAITQSIRTLQPNLNGPDLGEAVQRQILRMAGQAEMEGHDPAEYLYHQAKSWGYKPAEAKPEGDKPEEKAKPDFKSIIDSKKKSASSMTPGGKSGKIPLSREAVLDKNFGLADFARLTPSQLKELETM